MKSIQRLFIILAVCCSLFWSAVALAQSTAEDTKQLRGTTSEATEVPLEETDEAAKDTSTSETSEQLDEELGNNSKETPTESSEPPKKQEKEESNWKRFWKDFWNGRKATETFITEYVGDNGQNDEEAAYGDDDNFWNFRNILYLQARNRYLDTGIRMDLNLFHNPPPLVHPPEDFVPGGDGYTLLNYGNDFRVERVWATAHIKKIHITGGDFPVNFGRGIALSLIKLDDTGADNALRGGKFELKIPRKVKLQFVGGITNTLNVDPLTHAVQEDDPMDRIVGSRLEWQLMDAFSIGAHGVFMEPRFKEENEIDSPHRLWIDQGPGIRVGSGGGSIELHAAGLSIYMEGNGQVHNNYRVTSGTPVMREPGAGAFGEVSYDLSPYFEKSSFLIKAEGIFYNKWVMEGAYRGSATHSVIGPPVQYHHMPTLEPQWMIIHSLGNAAGGRYSGDWYIKKTDTQISLLTSTIKYHGGLSQTGDWDNYPPTFIVHPIVKLRQTFKKTGIMLAIEGGYRYEHTDEPEGGHADSGYLWHTMLDLSVPISGPHSVEVKNETRRHHLGISESNDDYWVVMNTLGYDMAGLWGIALIHEYSNEIPAEFASDVKLGSWTLPIPDNHYLWAMINFHPPKPLDKLSVRLLGGSQRGGLKCAGGVCRVYPDAVGARMELVYRF